ncbi:MAG: hypothetical protein V1772_02335 [Chloroflexota bacterium]
MQSSTMPAVRQPKVVGTALSALLDDSAELRSYLPADLDLGDRPGDAGAVSAPGGAQRL